MIEKITSEVPFEISQKTFEQIRRHTDVFCGWTKREIDSLIPYFKILNFTKNSLILSEREEVQFIGLVLSGKILQLKHEKIMSYLETGELFGYYPWFKLRGTLLSNFNYLAESDGYVALITYAEMKLIQKKDPLIYFKFIRVLHLYGLQVLNYQFTGEDLAFKNELTYIDVQFKDFVAMIKAFPEFARFFGSVDKSGQRALFNAFKIIEVHPEVSLLGESYRREHQGNVSSYSFEGRVPRF